MKIFMTKKIDAFKHRTKLRHTLIALPDKSVIILGDFNDLLEDSPNNNVFNTILMDTDNYLFADQPILDLPTYQWSFPSWPSSRSYFDYQRVV